jgi:hypothetical protein
MVGAPECTAPRRPHRSMFATYGSHPDGRGAPKISKIGWRNALKTPPKMGEKIVEYCGGCPWRGEGRAVTGATDVFLTHGVYRLGSGWACRAKLA